MGQGSSSNSSWGPPQVHIHSPSILHPGVAVSACVWGLVRRWTAMFHMLALPGLCLMYPCAVCPPPPLGLLRHPGLQAQYAAMWCFLGRCAAAAAIAGRSPNAAAAAGAAVDHRSEVGPLVWHALWRPPAAPGHCNIRQACPMCCAGLSAACRFRCGCSTACVSTPRAQFSRNRTD
jgi:hypothetical protein